MTPKQQPWIETGYRVFAHEGPTGLKVERLARAVGKNKSSFYHLFADLEVLTEVLLEHHLAQAQLLGEREAQAADLAELIDVLVAHKLDLLFSRQLRIHRENPDFERCFTRTNEITLPGFMALWKQLIGLEENSYLAGLVLQLSLENFFLQITDETLNHEWLGQYMANLKQLVREFKKNSSVAAPDGSV